MDWRLRRSEDVQQVQQNLVGALNNSVNSTEAIELLEQLKETLETQENQFYATLSCDLPTLQKNYQTAHSYLTSLQSGVIGLENQCVEAFSKKGLGVDKEQLVKEFLRVINNQIPTVFSGHVPKAETFVKDLMQEGLGADASGRINFRQKSAMGRMDKVGLGVLELVMNYKGETNPVQVVMKKDSNYQLIDHKTIKLIQDYLHLAIERLPLDKKAFEEFVLERVSNQIVREIVVEGLREGSIAINRSEASIRGFFGEVYAKAALYSLFRTKNVFIFTSRP